MAPPDAPQGRPRSQLRRDLRSGAWDSFLSTSLVFLTLPANLVIAALLTQVFGVGKGAFGILVSLPSWFNFFQLFLVPLLRMSPRAIAVGCVWAQIMLWTVLLCLLPFLPREDGAATPFFFVLLTLSALVTSLAGVGWTIWMRDVVPGRVRGAHFGLRNRYATIATVGFLLLISLFTGQAAGSIYPYMAVIALALLLRAGGLYNLHRTSEGVYRQPRRDWSLKLAQVFRCRPFMLFVCVNAFIAFCINFVNPFLPVFMYEQLGLSVSQTTLYFLLSSVAGAVMMPVWGRLLDRHGYVPVIMLSLLLMSLSDIGWLLAGPDRVWIVPILWLGYGLTSPGYLLGIFNMMMKLIPRELMVGGVSVNLAISSVMAAVAPMLQGAFVVYGPQVLGSVEAVYRAGFIGKPLLIVLSLLVLRRVKEPPSAGEPTMLGAMRTLRHVMFTTGLAFLTNFNFPRKRRSGQR